MSGFPLRGALLKEQKKRGQLSEIYKKYVEAELVVSNKIDSVKNEIRHLEKARSDAFNKVGSFSIKKGWVASQYNSYINNITKKIENLSEIEEQLSREFLVAEQKTKLSKHNLMLSQVKIDKIEKEKLIWKRNINKIKLDNEDEELHDLLN